MVSVLRTVPLSLLSRSHPMGAQKAALRQLTKGSAAKEHSPRVTLVSDYRELLLFVAGLLRCPVRFRPARHLLPGLMLNPLPLFG